MNENALSMAAPAGDAEAMEPEIVVSVVMPCLNEAEGVGTCVAKARRALEAMGVRGEVVVVDNGSTDSSAEIASRPGPRVVHEPRRGYGSAYLRGFAEARGRYLVMGDADDTYDFTRIADFIAPLEAGGCDMVMGSRLRGTILPGAMPWHHRWIGNPALTGLLNVLFRTGVSDAHCGLRMVARSALPRLDLRSPGLELASETGVNRSQAGARSAGTGIACRRGRGGSGWKLHSVRDGLRHVRYILAWASGTTLAAPVAALAAVGMVLLLLPGASLRDVAAGAVLLTAAALALQ